MTIPLLFTLCLAAPTPAADVTASLLSGKTTSGQLVAFADGEVHVQTDAAGLQQIPLDDLAELRWAADAPESLKGGQCYLTDGTVMSFEQAVTRGSSVILRSACYRQVSVPQRSIRAVRVTPRSDSTRLAWRELLDSENKRDLLVYPKQTPGELDHMRGVAGAFGERELKFVVESEEIPVPLENVFGVIFARPTRPALAPFVLHVADADVLLASEVVWKAETSAFAVRLLSGVQATVPVTFLRRIDCSGGKIRYLSDLDPVVYEFTPEVEDELYEQILRYRRNQNADGEPLRLRGREYARGLWIHSRTRLVYRPRGEFSRFEAIAGIDDKVARGQRTRLRLTIRADDRVLFDSDIWTTDEPRQLRFDIREARDFEILVDFADETPEDGILLGAGIQDWLDLAEARFIR